jgi:diguanylate cyclase (GGDEF)-like protein/PAS domain S-box-containing protein
LESSTEGIFGLDLDGRITFINPAASAMLGYPVETLLGERPYALLRHANADGTPFDGCDCPLHRAATEGIEHHGIRTLFYRRDGNPIPIEYKAAPIRHGGHADGAVVSFHDISERLDHERRIEFLAFHDALTGVANRRMFTERLKEALARYRRGGECFALHLLDLDHFKEVNDRLGHPTGDRLLFAIAQRVDGLLREVDLLARLGGDEFAVIQRGVRRPVEAVRLAERMLDALRADFPLGDVTVHSESSIGITLPQAETLDAADLMKQADIALYRAKDAGRGIAVLFEPG